MISYRQADLMDTLHKGLKTITWVDPTLINHKAQYTWYKYGNAIAWNGFPIPLLEKIPMIEVRLIEHSGKVLEHMVTNRDEINAFFRETRFRINDTICDSKDRFIMRFWLPK